MLVGPSKQKILIVDDMPINIQILGEALKSEYQIKVATRGEKALEIASSDDPPDLILLDIMMPEMDGFEVCRRLKNDHRMKKKIPVIFITVKDEVEDETKGLSIGAVDYITKPFKMPIVKARIKTQLALKKKTDMLEKLVLLDGLTNIPNRRRFDEVLSKEWRRAIRNARHPISLIMMDIDFFKNYNDYYGHSAGDDCLKKVAGLLENLIARPADLVARYGGEEFVALLPETDIDGACHLARKIQESIDIISIPHERSLIVDHITLSLGVACAIPPVNLNQVVLIESADKMLYEAKSEGRNNLKYSTIEDERE